MMLLSFTFGPAEAGHYDHRSRVPGFSPAKAGHYVG